LEFLYEYGLFLAKTTTIVVAIGVIIGLIASAASRGRHEERKGHIEVTKLNHKFEDMADSIRHAILDHKELKREQKARKKKEKEEAKQAKKKDKKAEGSEVLRKRRVYVINFHGDIKASETDELRHSISAVLNVAEPTDEVVVTLESPGGMVHGYGLAASQLARIRKAQIPLTVSVDKVAASGGYMMACVANKIIAAPFAIVGSIGVVAQLPNFHRLLKKHDVDYEMLTAGEYKRTLTMFGENTDRGRAKFQEDLEDTHVLFKDFIRANREQVDVDQVATGEIWFGQRAVDKNLVDDVQTSDEYLMSAYRDEADIYAVEYKYKKSLPERVGLHTEAMVERVLGNLWQKSRLRFFS
jgi:serine protease SohB